MKNDYSQLSDVEIAIEVQRKINNSPLVGNEEIGERWIKMNAVMRDFDPCNNWSDAGPIIVGNDISIEAVVVNRHLTTWRASHKPTFIKHVNTNPLRAAMIVFLEMQK